MNALESLAEYCGIVDSFVDARGERQTASKETQIALLAAMGVDASDETSTRHALARLERQRAQQSIPPVFVHDLTSGAIEIEVEGDFASSASQWRIELEGGDVKRGPVQAVPPDNKASAGRRYVRIEDEIPCGYHTLVIEPGDSRCSLIVSPGKCWLPAGVETGNKFWGVAIQLYLLRSETNWGIGDFGDLKRLVEVLAVRGADVVGLNPLHAMFPDDPEQASPYSPASRLMLNILNIDVARLSQTMNCDAARARLDSLPFQQVLAHCRKVPLLDYSAVAALKLPILQQLFEACDRSGPDWQSFVAFRATAGAVFERGCLFFALRSRFASAAPTSADWHQWPEEYRRADSPAVIQYAKENAEAVTFQAWLQFVADTQLRDCSEAASHMAIGLYRDLAVGANPAGAETWANPAAVIDKVQVGAPPDIYNPKGQDWGLPPFNPQALRAEGYQSFIELLRANMRHAGGIRIDHVMALQQLYWVPKGRSPAEGAFVRYPLEDLVGILALESQRNKCLVVGEDLGTVPEGFRERMQRAKILSYRVLFFEKDQDGFIAPNLYPALALAVASSHDLPTLRAWWQGKDLSLKARLNLYPTQSHIAQARAERDADREALATRMRVSRVAGNSEIDAEAFVEAAHALLARTRSILSMLQIDDLTGEIDPVNVPTTADEHPNWRRRISVSLEQLINDPRFDVAAAAMAAQRRSTP